MRKVVSYLISSLDCVVEEPSDWVFDRFDDEMIGHLKVLIDAQDAVLLGRTTYEQWAPEWPESTFEPFASFINNTPKYVASTTLREVTWQNSTLWNRNVAEEVAKLKSEPGKDIGVHGSATLVRSLIREGLLDELKLAVVPVVAGTGERLFDDFDRVQRMDLVDVIQTGTGIALMTYRPRV